MNYDRILIRYGELTLKGRNRSHFVQKLKKNIKFILRNYKGIQIISQWDRMYIILNEEPAEPIIQNLQQVFGIHSISPTIRTEKRMEDILEAALYTVKQAYTPGQSFKISARRTDKQFELDTNGINHEVGGHILKNIEGIHVNVKKPDINVIVEIRHDAAYISGKVFKGAGGFPVASSGKAMLMLSGGIDSPVAGYLVMKRGVGVEAVHFHSPPFTSERAKQKVLDLARKLAQYSGSVKVHIVPFTEIQETIHKEIPSGYSMTTTRRMMLKITDEIRRRQGGLAIVTGESLGQVASQTMDSMYAINSVTSTPIIRPLIAMDKLDIIQIAENIDTYEISNRPYEDCCTIFTPPSPKTRPNLEKVEVYESKYQWEDLLNKAVEHTETIMISARVDQEKDDTEDLF